MRCLLILLFSIMALSCSHAQQENRAVYVLLDRSGTYAQQFEVVTATVKLLLSKLEPGDSFALARIDNEIFSEQDIVARVTFSSRPSQSNVQKRAVLNVLQQLATATKAGSYTDVTGGMLQAMGWLNATGAKHKLIIVFSDFPDEPREGYMREFPLNFNRAQVLVWNASQAESLAGVALAEAQSFSERAKVWQQRVVAGGGSWQMVNDPVVIEAWFH